MAEASSPTNKLYLAKAKAMQAGESFDRPLYIALDKGDMSAFDASTNAPASEATEDGVARAAAILTLQQTTIANDTCRVYKSFSVGASVPLTGALAMSAESEGNALAWHRWAATANVQSGDTINEQIDIVDKVGAD
jgi:hypothetical protein